jgi:hypothetical protein
MRLSISRLDRLTRPVCHVVTHYDYQILFASPRPPRLPTRSTRIQRQVHPTLTAYQTASRPHGDDDRPGGVGVEEEDWRGRDGEGRTGVLG